ncbi:hypothetical protein B0H14DRAFT_3458059 [Mycena olivaceomarginata]|nr:hypothetical protein B0H14DRAFT_3458059 [Mycena olivaceomarginata]
MHAPPYPAFLAVLLLSSTLWVYDKTDNPASFAGYMHLVVESAMPLAVGSGGAFGFLGRKKDGAGGKDGAGMLEKA